MLFKAATDGGVATFYENVVQGVLVVDVHDCRRLGVQVINTLLQSRAG